MGLGNRVRAWFSGEPRPPVELSAGPMTATFGAYTPVDTMLRAISDSIGRIDRAAALSVPAVLRGRNYLCHFSTLPLQAVDASNHVIDQPLLRQLDSNVANSVVLSETIEDLVFDSVSWWRVTARGSDGFPSSIARYDVADVSLLPPAGYREGYLPSGLPTEGAVWMGGEPVAKRDAIRFDSPNPPLLVAGERVIRRALALDKLADLYASNPRRRGYFVNTTGQADPEQTEIERFQDRMQERARRQLDGYLPQGIDYKVSGDPTPAEMQIVAMQQQVTHDLANALGLDPEDLGLNVTSRTYANIVDKRIDKINEILSPFMAAITERLSMPDVTKRNVTVRFWLDGYLRADPKTRAEVNAIYHGLGVTDAAEIREDEGLPPRVIEAPAAPEQVVEQAHAEPATATFDSDSDAPGMTFDSEAVREAFAVDEQRRTITGLAIPWNEWAYKGGRWFRFKRGGQRFGKLDRVKMLEDHNWSLSFGHATKLLDTESGLLGTYKVARGEHGDKMLTLAVDKAKDGLSIGVDWDEKDVVRDPARAGAWLVQVYTIRETSLLANPAFDSSRLTSVVASADTGEETGMPEETTETVPAEQAPVTFSAEQFAQFMARMTPAPVEPVETPAVVDPTRRPVATTFVSEALPYRFARHAGNGEVRFSNDGEHNFHDDLRVMAGDHDNGMAPRSEASKRVMGLMHATFAEVDSSDVAASSPTLHIPSMYTEEPAYKLPIWSLIGRGAPPAPGGTSFDHVKDAGSSGLVANHTEGDEPASGTGGTTTVPVTQTALSGKVSVTREAWMRPGNPSTSSYLWNKIVRAWWEGLEQAAATYLQTLTAAANIDLTAGAVDAELTNELEAELTALQFVRNYDFRGFVVERGLYMPLAAAEDTTGRKIYPALGPTNASGTAQSKWSGLDINGLTARPSWALTATADAVNNSWLFDPSVVYGWATAPQRLEFPGTDPSDGSYAPIAFVDLGVWGWKAFHTTDIAGVRQVTYDDGES